jgi:hypothetical protein
MRWRPVVLVVLFSVSWTMFACESDVSEQGGDEETACVTSLDQIDFGQVIVGEFRDTCITIGVASEGDHIAGTIVIDCPDFHFVDTLSGQTFDTLIYDLTYPEDTSFCVRFEPEETVPTICSVERGSDCGDLGISGMGVLSGYQMELIDFPSGLDLYDVALVWDLGVIVCGDSGMVAASMDLSTWTDICSGPLTTSPLRDMELIYDTGGSLISVLFVGGGGGTNGLVFGECSLVLTYNEIEYLTSSLVFTDGEHIWLMGRGHDISDEYNGVYHSMAGIDSFTLYQPTSEITGIDGSTSSDVWAVLSEPSHSLYHFDGETWELRTEGWMTESLQGVWVHESGEAFAVGSNGAIYHYTGSVWEDQSLDFETGTLYGVFGFTSTDVFAVGEGTAVYHYDGDIWEAMPTPTGMTKTLFAVHGLDIGDLAKLIFAVGEDGVIIGYAPDIPLPSFGTGLLPGGGAGLFEWMKR